MTLANGMIRPQLEKYLYEQLGITNLNQSHALMLTLLMHKLKSKEPHVMLKAVDNEGKVVFKWKDVETMVLGEVALTGIRHRIEGCGLVKKVKVLGKKGREKTKSPGGSFKKERRNGGNGVVSFKPIIY